MKWVERMSNPQHFWRTDLVMVALAAKKRRGKDTVAQFMQEDHGFTAFALADPIRECVLTGIQNSGSAPAITWSDLIGEGRYDRENDQAFSLSQFIEVAAHGLKALADEGFDKTHHYHDFDKARNLVRDTVFNFDLQARDCTIRRMLQFMGTDIVCDQINRMAWLEKTWQAVRKSRASRVVITDCRQDHELLWMRQQGVIVVGIERPEADKNESLEDDHVTEKGLRLIRGVDPIILNNEAGLDRLREKTELCVNYILREVSAV